MSFYAYKLLTINMLNVNKDQLITFENKEWGELLYALSLRLINISSPHSFIKLQRTI
jgi:hypothetical protein